MASPFDRVRSGLQNGTIPVNTDLRQETEKIAADRQRTEKTGSWIRDTIQQQRAAADRKARQDAILAERQRRDQEAADLGARNDRTKQQAMLSGEDTWQDSTGETRIKPAFVVPQDPEKVRADAEKIAAEQDRERQQLIANQRAAKSRELDYNAEAAKRMAKEPDAILKQVGKDLGVDPEDPQSIESLADTDKAYVQATKQARDVAAQAAQAADDKAFSFKGGADKANSAVVAEANRVRQEREIQELAAKRAELSAKAEAAKAQVDQTTAEHQARILAADEEFETAVSGPMTSDQYREAKMKRDAIKVESRNAIDLATNRFARTYGAIRDEDAIQQALLERKMPKDVPANPPATTPFSNTPLEAPTPGKPAPGNAPAEIQSPGLEPLNASPAVPEAEDLSDEGVIASRIQERRANQLAEFQATQRDVISKLANDQMLPEEANDAVAAAMSAIDTQLDDATQERLSPLVAEAFAAAEKDAKTPEEAAAKLMASGKLSKIAPALGYDDAAALYLANVDTATFKPKPEPVEEKGWFAQLKRAPIVGDVVRGAEVSTRQLPQLGFGVAALIGDTLEKTVGKGETLRNWGFRGYLDAEQGMAPISREDDDVTVAWSKASKGNLGAMANFLEYAVGYGIGQILETIAVSAAGGAIGGAAGTAVEPGGGTAVGAVGGALGGAFAKGAVKTGIRKFMAEAIAGQAEKMALKQLGKTAAKSEVKALAQTATLTQAAAKAIGSNTAILTNALGMELGAIYGEAAKRAKEEGRELTGWELARVWGTGIAAGGLESVADKFGLDLLGGKKMPKGVTGRAVRAATGAAEGVAMEGGTEALQTVLERVGAGQNPIDAEGRRDIINATAMGGIMGGSVGAIGGALSSEPVNTATPQGKIQAAWQNAATVTTPEALAAHAGIDPAQYEALVKDFGDPSQAAAKDFATANLLTTGAQQQNRHSDVLAPVTEAIQQGTARAQERAKAMVDIHTATDPEQFDRALFAAQDVGDAQAEADIVTQQQNAGYVRGLAKVLGGGQLTKDELDVVNAPFADKSKKAIIEGPGGTQIVSDLAIERADVVMPDMGMGAALKAINPMGEVEATQQAQAREDAKAAKGAKQSGGGMAPQGTTQPEVPVSPGGEAGQPGFTYTATMPDGQTVSLPSEQRLGRAARVVLFQDAGVTIPTNTPITETAGTSAQVPASSNKGGAQSPAEIEAVAMLQSGSTPAEVRAKLPGLTLAQIKALANPSKGATQSPQSRASFDKGSYRVPAEVAAWDQQHRTERHDEWFDGANVNESARRGFDEARANGGHDIQAHGMAKAGTLSGGLADLLNMITNGLDPSRIKPYSNGELMLETAPLVSEKGGSSAGATPNGSAYSDGPFQLLARPGQYLEGQYLEGLGAILINEAHADQAAPIKAEIAKVRPDLIVGTYSEAGAVVAQLNAKAKGDTKGSQTGQTPEGNGTSTGQAGQAEAPTDYVKRIAPKAAALVDVFPGGVSDATEAQRKEMGDSPMAYLRGRLIIQRDRLALYSSDQAETLVRHELIHHAMKDAVREGAFSDADVAGVWSALGGSREGKKLQRLVRNAYFSSRSMKAEAAGASDFVLGAEMIRMMVEDAEFAGQISEAVIGNAEATSMVRRILRELRKWLKLAIKQLGDANPELKAELEAMAEATAQALRNLKTEAATGSKPATKPKDDGQNETLNASGAAPTLNANTPISRPSGRHDFSRVGTAWQGKVKPTTRDTNDGIHSVDAAGLAKQMPKVTHFVDDVPLPSYLMESTDPETRRDVLIDFFKGNILALYDAFDTLGHNLTVRSTHWYDGARLIAESIASDNGITNEQAAGIMAVLSPMKDWFQNVAMAQRMADVFANHRDVVITRKQFSKTMRGMLDSAQDAAKRRKEFKLLEGRSINDLWASGDPVDKRLAAVATRLLSQHFHGLEHQVLSPEGENLGLRRNLDGSTKTMVWQADVFILKGLSVAYDGSPENISATLGGEHKIRNFYNNIIAPNSPAGDATIDTHAVNASALYPMGNKGYLVGLSFGDAGVAGGGNSGIYWMFHEAYRQAAEERGIMPRQMQSVTWEAVRGLFTDDLKRSKAFVGQVTQMWANSTDAESTRQQIIGLGIRHPEWARFDAGSGPRPSGKPSVSGKADGKKADAKGSVRSGVRQGIARSGELTTPSEQSFTPPQADPVTPPENELLMASAAVPAAMARRFGVTQESDPFAFAYLNRRRGKINTQEVKTRADLDAFAEAEFARRSANRFQVDPESIRRLEPVIRKAAEKQVKYGLAEGKATLELLDTPSTEVLEIPESLSEWLRQNGLTQPRKLADFEWLARVAAKMEDQTLRAVTESFIADRRGKGWSAWVEENVNRPRREAAESWAKTLSETWSNPIVSSEPNPDGGVDVVFANGESGLFESVEEAMRDGQGGTGVIPQITDAYSQNLAWDILEHSMGSRVNYGLGRPRELSPEILESTLDLIRSGEAGDPLFLYDEERARSATKGLRTIKAGEGHRWVFVPGGAAGGGSPQSAVMVTFEDGSTIKAATRVDAENAAKDAIEGYLDFSDIEIVEASSLLEIINDYPLSKYDEDYIGFAVESSADPDMTEVVKVFETREDAEEYVAEYKGQWVHRPNMYDRFRIDDTFPSKQEAKNDARSSAIEAELETLTIEEITDVPPDHIKSLMALSPDSWCTNGESMAREYLSTKDYWLLLPPTGSKTIGGIRLFTGTNRMQGINGVNNAEDARQLIGDHAKRIALLVRAEGIDVTDAATRKAIASVSPSTTNEILKASGAVPQENIAPEDAIVMFGSGGTQMSVGPVSRQFDELIADVLKPRIGSNRDVVISAEPLGEEVTDKDENGDAVEIQEEYKVAGADESGASLTRLWTKRNGVTKDSWLVASRDDYDGNFYESLDDALRAIEETEREERGLKQDSDNEFNVRRMVKREMSEGVIGSDGFFITPVIASTGSIYIEDGDARISFRDHPVSQFREMEFGLVDKAIIVNYSDPQSVASGLNELAMFLANRTAGGDILKASGAVPSGDGEYRGVHKAPTGKYGEGSLDAMDRTYPDDLYGPNGPRYYGDTYDPAMDRKMHRIIVAMRGKPDAPVKVYRAAPKGVASEINPGDWVTPSREYAVMHGERFDDGADIIERTVKAGELFTEGNSIFEFGWSPQSDDILRASGATPEQPNRYQRERQRRIDATVRDTLGIVTGTPVPTPPKERKRGKVGGKIAQKIAEVRRKMETPSEEPPRTVALADIPDMGAMIGVVHRDAILTWQGIYGDALAMIGEPGDQEVVPMFVGRVPEGRTGATVMVRDVDGEAMAPVQIPVRSRAWALAMPEMTQASQIVVTSGGQEGIRQGTIDLSGMFGGTVDATDLRNTGDFIGIVRGPDGDRVYRNADDEEPVILKASAATPLANRGSDSDSGSGPVWGPKFQKAISREYTIALAGDDFGSQYDILAAKYNNDPNASPEMRSALLKELEHLENLLGDEWLNKYSNGRTFSKPPLSDDIRYSAAPAPLLRSNVKAVREALKNRFGGSIPSGVRVVDLPNETWFGLIQGNEILVNAARNQARQAPLTVAHEIGHYVWRKPGARKAFDRFTELLTDAERARVDEIIRDFYDGPMGEYASEERAVLAFENMIAKSGPDTRTAWERLVNLVTRAVKKLFGVALTPAEAKAQAWDIFASGLRDFKGGPMNGDARYSSKPGGMSKDAARHTELEAKFNAGTITEAETREAQRITRKAARDAGFTEKGWHGGAKGIKEFSTPTFFATEKRFAEAFAKQFHGDDGQVYETFIAAKNPLRLDRLGVKSTQTAFMRFLQRNGIDLDFDPITVWDSVRSILTGEEKADTYETTQSLVDDDDFVAALRNAGFDSITQIEPGESLATGNTKSLIVIDPSQIKLADPFTGVNLDERFNPASDDIRYSYAGASANTPAFMRDSLESARAMAAAGKSSEEIRAVTGWFPGKYDGKLRFEIPDDAAKWRVVDGQTYVSEAAGRNAKVRLGALLDHPELFRAYPDAESITVAFKGTDGGSFNPTANEITIGRYAALSSTESVGAAKMLNQSAIRTLIHEVQHWIQEREGFARGGSSQYPEQEFARLEKLGRNKRNELNQKAIEINSKIRALNEQSMQSPDWQSVRKSPEYVQAMADLEAQYEANLGQTAALTQALRDLRQVTTRMTEDERFDLYLRVAGEIEARDVQDRMDLTPEQRKAVAPYSSENIAPEDAIVMFGASGPQMSAGESSDILKASGAVPEGTTRRNFLKTTAGAMAASFFIKADAARTIADLTELIPTSLSEAEAMMVKMSLRGRRMQDFGKWLAKNPVSGKGTVSIYESTLQKFPEAQALVDRAAQLNPAAFARPEMDGIDWLIAPGERNAINETVRITLKPRPPVTEDKQDAKQTGERQPSRPRTGGEALFPSGLREEVPGMLFASAAAPDIATNQFGDPINIVWDVPPESKMDNVIYAMQDKQVDTKRIQSAIESQIGALDDDVNPYRQETLFHGKTSKQTKDFLQDELRPLMDDMAKRGVGVEEFEEFLHNRHAEERNDQIARINPTFQGPGSGITTADAQAYLLGLDPAKRADFQALAARVDAITKGTRRMLVATGLETRGTIQAWEGAYSQYIPLMREELEFSTTGSGSGTGQGFSVKGSSSKRATGSTRPVVDVLANIAIQREKAIVKANKAEVGKAIYGLALTAPNPKFWLAVNPDAVKDPVALGNELMAMGLDPALADSIMAEPRQAVVNKSTGLVEYRINTMARTSPNVLAVRILGKDRYVFFNANNARSQRMVSAMKNLDSDQLGWVLGNISKVTRYFSAVNTQYNPIFGVVNLTRDAEGAIMNLESTEIADRKRAVFSNIAPALFGIYGDLRKTRKGKPSGNGKWAKLWEEFQNEGGQTGYRDVYATSADRGEALKSMIDPSRWADSGIGKVFTAGGILKMPLEAARKSVAAPLFDLLSDYNEAMENAVRLSAYAAAKGKGLTNANAANIAKDLTVNFNRKGQIAVQVGALYAFFNASMQGSARLAQTLKSPAGKKIIAGGLLLGVAQAIGLAAAGYDDDDPPEFVRERNIIIPLPNKKYVTIPLPLGLHVIPNFSRVVTEWVMGGGEDWSGKLGQIVSSFLDAFNPIGHAGFSAQTLTPTFMDPMVALGENRDYTGKPIAREDFNNLDPSPGYTRTKDTASEFSKTLAEFMNLSSGGSKYRPGKISPTPDQIDYLIGQATGGVGREVLKFEQTGRSMVTGEDLPAYKVPLLGRFYGEVGGPSGVSGKFYDNITEMNGHEREIKGRRENGEPIGEYVKAHPETRLISAANEAANRIGDLRKMKRAQVEKGNKAGVQKIEAQMTKVMESFNARVEELRESAKK